MFTKVNTKEEMETFNDIFKASFQEKKYETDEFDGEANRYLIHNRHGDVAGTIELIPYRPGSGFTTIEDMFAFSSLPELSTLDFSKVYEIDKLSVMESERKNGTLDNVIRSLFVLTCTLDVECFIALINPILFRSLRIEYNLPAKRVGKMIRTEDYAIQPMLIYTKDLIHDTSWDKKGLMKELKPV